MRRTMSARAPDIVAREYDIVLTVLAPRVSSMKFMSKMYKILMKQRQMKNTKTVTLPKVVTEHTQVVNRGYSWMRNLTGENL